MTWNDRMMPDEIPSPMLGWSLITSPQSARFIITVALIIGAIVIAVLGNPIPEWMTTTILVLVGSLVDVDKFKTPPPHSSVGE